MEVIIITGSFLYDEVEFIIQVDGVIREK